MAALCNTTDMHLTSTVPGAPSTGEEISIVTWMSGVWSVAATPKSFVGIYGPSASDPTTALQMGSRNTNGTCVVWTWGGDIMIATPAIMVDWANHFIVYTFDGSHRLYVDGILRATSATSQIAGQFNTFFINGYPGGLTSEVSNHKVESVRMYNRALSLQEIQTMHATQGARHNIINGLIAHYELDEGHNGTQITTSVDLSGHGAHLTRTGAGTPMTYTYSSGEAKLRPAVIN